MHISEAIRNRRSIYPKTYTGEIIDTPIIEEILEAACWAPTHRHTRPWHFIVFEGEGKEKLANFQSNYYREHTAPEQFSQATFDKLISKPKMASHIIAIGMKRDPKRSVPEIEEIESVACAVQNMHLTATSHGIGAYWGTGGVTYQEEAKSFFGLSKEDKLLGFFFLGVPKIDWPKGRDRDWKKHVQWISK